MDWDGQDLDVDDGTRRSCILSSATSIDATCKQAGFRGVVIPVGTEGMSPFVSCWLLLAGWDNDDSGDDPAFFH